MPHYQVGLIDRSKNPTFYWKIPNFNNYRHIDSIMNYLVSPVFSTSKSGEGFKWQMKLTGDTFHMSDRRFLGLTIECLSNDFRVATITAGILKNNNADLVVRTSQYERNDITLSFFKLADRNFVSDSANEILSGGILTVFCKIVMGKINLQPSVCNIAAVEHTSSDKNNKLSHEASMRLEEFDDFENLLNDQDFGDLKISIEDKTIMAHKCILAKRSPVFAAMFRSDMTELRNNSVEFKEIEYDIFMEMLRFVYSGKVHRLEKIAMDLLAVADMFQLTNLKILCEMELTKQLGVDNAIQILKLADKHHVEGLKKEAIKYIVENRKDIFDQAEFRGLVGNELMYEVCQAMK